jgi:hypothetical protein
MNLMLSLNLSLHNLCFQFRVAAKELSSPAPRLRSLNLQQVFQIEINLSTRSFPIVLGNHQVYDAITFLDCN